jgi:Site-specific recombinase XerD
MNKKIILRRVFHREKPRIFISFDYDPEIDKIARSLGGRNFSSTNKCWYVDDTEESVREILRAFKGKADVDISAISLSYNRNNISNPDTGEQPGRMPFTTIVKSPPEDDPSEPVEVPRTIVHREKKPGTGYEPVEFRISDADGRLSIRFTGRYNSEWIDEIRSYGKFYYDKIHKEFLLRWSQLTVDSLSDYFALQGVKVKVIKPVVGNELKSQRKEFGDEVRSRQLMPAAIEGLDLLRNYLDENRYSGRTSEAYLSLLEVFFKYYNEKDPSDISQSEVSEFMNTFIVKLGFSASYQNQMISAIKTYYEISGTGKVIPQIMERPRRGRALPKVFSKDEITRILGSARNSKHRLLLWMIYSCGLRRSEATNIKITDLDRDRGILHIREGKGRIDRVVPVSDKVWVKLDEYISGYQPAVYLFEGQGGGKYSVESVYNVFKQALKKTGINKEVGVHSLRHSYATHLHESGLDIRYIQELLGHRSSKTTEIYTHVSRRNLVAVRSPIEDLDLK